MAGMIKS